MGRLVHLPPHVAAVVGALAVLALAYAAFFSRPAPSAARPATAAPVAFQSLVGSNERPRASARSSAPKPAAGEPRGFDVAAPRAGHALVVRARPHGRVVARLGSRTEFGSPQTVGVVKRRGGWLAVVTTELPNRTLGWVDPRESPLRLTRTRKSLELDLSRRRLVLRRGDRVLRRMTVGIGRPSSPTPTGRFAVTDKLAGARFGQYYGCCIIALSAHQPRLPSGWRGGDRVAIHGTNDPGSIGVPSSAGCPHARDADLRFLLSRVPLGTPVFVRR
jgi:lipoprotein-anchoring transpeptidase ErfK/SrfK